MGRDRESHREVGRHQGRGALRSGAWPRRRDDDHGRGSTMERSGMGCSSYFIKVDQNLKTFG